MNIKITNQANAENWILGELTNRYCLTISRFSMRKVFVLKYTPSTIMAIRSAIVINLIKILYFSTIINWILFLEKWDLIRIMDYISVNVTKETLKVDINNSLEGSLLKHQDKIFKLQSAKSERTINFEFVFLIIKMMIEKFIA